MFTLDEIAQEFAEVAKGYPLVRAYVFGSQARGDASSGSDIDFVLDVSEGFSLFDLCGLKNELEERFGASVDVVTRGGLKESYRSSVAQDEVLVYEAA